MNEYGEWDSCSLTDDQIKKYSEMFETPIIVLEQMQATEILPMRKWRTDQRINLSLR